MPTLLYRGQNYVQHKEQKTQKDCVELTYRRNPYNTCRNIAKSELNAQLAYRGRSYQHQTNNYVFGPARQGYFFCRNIFPPVLKRLTDTSFIFIRPYLSFMQLLFDSSYIPCLILRSGYFGNGKEMSCVV